MKYLITKPQLSLFLRRRFSPEELGSLVNYIKDWIADGESVDVAIYESVREFIKDKKFSDIDEHGDEESYWNSYLKYETPLIAFVKSELGFE
jgi:hypothetical protein